MSSRHLHTAGVLVAAVTWFALVSSSTPIDDPTEYIRAPSGWRPSPWTLAIWAIGLVALTCTGRQPLVGVLALFVFEYGVPRYTPEYQFMLQLRLPELTAALTLAGWLVWRKETAGPWLPDSRLIPGLMTALIVWVAISAAAAMMSGEGWQPSRTQHPARYGTAAVVLFVCAQCLRTKEQFVFGIFGLWASLLVRVLTTAGGVQLDGDVGAFIPVAAPLAVLPLVSGCTLARLATAVSTCGMLLVLGVTRNRGGVVGLASAAFGSMVLAPSWRLRAFAIGPVLLALALPLASDPFKERFDDLWSRGIRAGSAGERLNLWAAAGRMLGDHPVTGVGPGNFPSRISSYDQGAGRLGAHNTVVAMFAETGWVGGAIFLLLFLAGVGLAAKTAWFAGGWHALAGMALGGSLVGYLGAGMFVGRQTQVVAYALLGAVVALQTRYSTDP